ncbi:MAG: serine hydrolase [Chloroflexi bacterium]|nr:MAG: serine hydrolase [Chloroflexota bacterium]
MRSNVRGVRFSFSGVHRLSVAVAATAIAFIALAPVGNDVHATTTTPNRTISLNLLIPSMTAASTNTASQVVQALNVMVARNPLTLTAAIQALVDASGASVGVSLIELGGAAPLVWSFNGSAVFTAASTYKLVALMMEAQNIASGKTNPNGYVCYEDADYEDGWYDDYETGACFTRNELARRAGLLSDNTAGRMLVRDVGGADAVNAWAASLGAKESVFFTYNTTSSDDLAVVWAAEAKGSLGGSAAQAWLYPMLTGTKTEAGIPAGVASRSIVVHKTGTLDEVDNDAALVVKGPNGAYALTVMSDGLGGAEGWQLISAISSAVWSFEAARAK